MGREALPTSMGLQGCLDTCRQCEALVRAITDWDESRRLFAMVGPHLSRCLDLFRSLLTGLESGVVNYDDEHTENQTGTDPNRFLAALFEVTAELAGLEGLSTTQPVEIIQRQGPKGPPVRVGSTFERELLFLSVHTMHHVALAAEICTTRGIKGTPGVATLRRSGRIGTSPGG